jgi:hypothetical protein
VVVAAAGVAETDPPAPVLEQAKRAVVVQAGRARGRKGARSPSVDVKAGPAAGRFHFTRFATGQRARQSVYVISLHLSGRNQHR